MDLTDLGTGLLLGFAVSGLYFAGLRLGVRIATSGTPAAAVLLVSAALRIALLLLAGWGAARLGVWCAVGFASAFLVTRVAVVAWTRRALAGEGR